MSSSSSSDDRECHDSSGTSSSGDGPHDGSGLLLHELHPGSDINVDSLDPISFPDSDVVAVQDGWRRFLDVQGSPEAAGSVIYSSLFENAPTMQALFPGAQAVQAPKLANALTNIIRKMGQPNELLLMVETLGFEHMSVDVTLPRVAIFRDTIIDVLYLELGETFTSESSMALRALLNYLGGAIMYVKKHYAERIRIIASSWALANRGNASIGMESSIAADATHVTKEEDNDESSAPVDVGKRQADVGTEGNRHSKHNGHHHHHHHHHRRHSHGEQDVNIPTTYKEMFQFNAAVMGLSDKVWLFEVLAVFDGLVKGVQNNARMQEECDVLGLRIAKVGGGTSGQSIAWMEYKSCMLASLRSLLPQDWTGDHEMAWSWMWDNVERHLTKNIASLKLWEKAWSRLLYSWSDEVKFGIRTEIYSRFFTVAPSGQDFFKQSNTFLHFIADRVFELTLEIFSDPVKMVDDVSALGLRHAGYGVPVDLFSVYVSSAVEVVRNSCAEDPDGWRDALEGFSWSLSLLARMLARTTSEGSTMVMKAITANSSRLLMKALEIAPRGQRANYVLLVQVGTQNISPFSWAISSGSQEAARAIIEDLLTIRADRERYYYGAGDLFRRHPDLVQTLCNDAPALLTPLLDGLVWRSAIVEKRQRRVNLFLQHLLIAQDGTMAPTIEWLSDFQDPRLACHPIVEHLSHMVWTRVTSTQFLLDKAWSMLTLTVFLVSQTIIEHLHEDDNFKPWERFVVFGCRAFVYLSALPTLSYRHGKQFYKDFKAKRYFKVLCFPCPGSLGEFKECLSFMLTLFLFSLLAMEPILWCWEHAGSKTFDAHCKEADHILMPYSIASSIAVLLYFVVLADMAVFSSRVSAFALLCGQMIQEVALFLVALAVCLAVFASALSVLDQHLVEFKDIPTSLFTLLEVATGTFPKSKYHHFEDEPVALLVVFLFLVVCGIFIVDLLIAQLTCAYQAVYKDMLGYARLSQMGIIAETAPYVRKKRWKRFVESLHFEQKIEFNAGDIGLAGGIQLVEPSAAHPTPFDRIRRYGGSTSRDKEWPPEDAKGVGDDTDRLRAMEQLVHKTLKKVKRGKRRRGGAGGSSSICDESSTKSGGGQKTSSSNEMSTDNTM